MSARAAKILAGVAAVALLAGGAGAVVLRRRPPAVPQPISFNHRRHLAEDMKCLDCHKGADKAPHAGVPTIKACMLCHEEPKGTDPEEARVREFAKRGEGIPWVQVNRLPGHVYFSHAAHVAFAKMDCKDCHGDMTAAVEPVTRSQVLHLDMDRCMKCHAEKGVSNDCLRCHQ